jgi:hypothetical protein
MPFNSQFGSKRCARASPHRATEREASRVEWPVHIRKASEEAIGRAGAQGTTELAVAGH